MAASVIDDSRGSVAGGVPKQWRISWRILHNGPGHDAALCFCPCAAFCASGTSACLDRASSAFRVGFNDPRAISLDDAFSSRTDYAHHHERNRPVQVLHDAAFGEQADGFSALHRPNNEPVRSLPAPHYPPGRFD
jgi:hypothetical protein